MESFDDLIRRRPARQTLDPPADKPLDQTGGGAPPYAFPPELIRELAGKSEEEVSSLLSKFRTGLSEHRTRLSEHRTDLSEFRTDLSMFRTELSSRRSGLSDDRSHLSNERTHLSYLRTAISLMSFGITINRFAVALTQAERLKNDDHALLIRMRHTEQLGLGMVIVGVVLMAWSLYRYRTVHAQILAKRFTPPALSFTVLTLAIIAFGVVSVVVMMVG